MDKDVPFDPKQGIIPNTKGHVSTGKVMSRAGNNVLPWSP